jgi:hypothetical protein
MNLRTAVNIRDSVAVRSDIDSVIEGNYKFIGNVSMTSIMDFFYPFVVKIFYVERLQEDSDTIDYLTVLLGKKMYTMANIPHSRTVFTKYVSDQHASARNSGYLTSEQFGDLSLFNTGILFPFIRNGSRRLGEDYFRSIGTMAYNMASTQSRNNDRKELFLALSHDFMFYEEGFRDLASRFIWGGPGEYLIDELSRASKAVKRSHDEESLLAYYRLHDQFNQGIIKTEKYQKMK